MNYGTDYLVDKYKIEFVENNIRMEMNVFHIYTANTMFRYTISGGDEYFSKSFLFLDKMLKSIKPL
jgi:CTP:phosphocholine cytidylyltransferase-like protein